MHDASESGPRGGAFKRAWARAAGVEVEVVEIGSATVLVSAERPGDIGLNRAYDVDPREPGVAARVVAHLRARGRRPLLEILPVEDTAGLAALGLAPLWGVATLRLDLAGPLPSPPPSDARVRPALPTEADAFGVLAVRAFGAPPPGVPPSDPDFARTWAGLCREGHARCFFAERAGVPCAIGVSLRVGDDAFVDGAATLSEHRGHGCQSALLSRRFHDARAQGARVALSRTGADSPSQRNLERAGMHLWQRVQVWGA